MVLERRPLAVADRPALETRKEGGPGGGCS